MSALLFAPAAVVLAIVGYCRRNPRAVEPSQWERDEYELRPTVGGWRA